MSPGWVLGITSASALVLLLGAALKTRYEIREELEAYATGYNRAEATGRFEYRYDSRAAAILLVVAMVLQIVAIAAGPIRALPSPCAIACQVSAGLLAALLAWRLPRGPLVRRDVRRLEEEIAKRWRRQDEEMARRRAEA